MGFAGSLREEMVYVFPFPFDHLSSARLLHTTTSIPQTLLRVWDNSSHRNLVHDSHPLSLELTKEFSIFSNVHGCENFISFLHFSGHGGVSIFNPNWLVFLPVCVCVCFVMKACGSKPQKFVMANAKLCCSREIIGTLDKYIQNHCHNSWSRCISRVKNIYVHTHMHAHTHSRAERVWVKISLVTQTDLLFGKD